MFNTSKGVVLQMYIIISFYTFIYIHEVFSINVININDIVKDKRNDKVYNQFFKEFDYKNSPSVLVIDNDNTSFTLKRYIHRFSNNESCYSMEKKNKKTIFCYPLLNIIGYPKCGTTAMYDFLQSHHKLIGKAHLKKEYCPTKSYYDYFSNLAHLFHETDVYHVNGCINAGFNEILHYILFPKSINILLVRDMSQRMWAAYNYWCSYSFDKDCDIGARTKDGMYRHPILFDQLVKAANYAYTKPIYNNFMFSCNKISTLYSDIIASITNNLNEHMPLIVIPEEDMDSLYQIKRLESFIKIHINRNITLNISNMHEINKGKSSVTDDKTLSTGLYSFSNYQPMLKSTTLYISNCWKDCQYISKIASYNYTCTHSQSNIY